MILPCEVAVKSVIPAIKATIAKELLETYGLKQNQVAEILGISQSAVSKYTRKVRGYVIKIDEIAEIQPLISEMISLLMGGKYKRAEFIGLFCQTCNLIRSKSLMCPFCKKADTRIKTKECGFCLTTTSPPQKEDKGN